MVVMSNPFCPVSFGFLGFLNAVISGRGLIFGSEGSDPKNKVEEEEDLLAVGEGDCDELSEDRITNFLENQKSQYYRSIGLAPPKQLQPTDALTTPGESMIEFSSSRETSFVGETDASTTPTPFTPQTFRMDDCGNDPTESPSHDPLVKVDASLPTDQDS
jgi:hypothetical protein